MMKKAWTYLAVFAIVLTGCGSPGETAEFPSGETVDLTYPFNEQTVFWPTAESFQLEVQSEGVTEAGYFYSANSFSMAEHGGTHLDAPYHFWEEGSTVDRIPPERLMGEGLVVDVSDSALRNPDYQVRTADFEEWEARHGEIPSGAVVLVKTGYGQFWPDREKYMGTAERGQEAVPGLHFPGLHPDAAEWLATRRDIKLVGLDTPSIDYGQSTGFESHVTLFRHGIPALENVANLDQLPPRGFQIIALPMKIEGGSGGPARVLAIISDAP